MIKTVNGQNFLVWPGGWGTLFLLLALGCSTPEANPGGPKAGRGYVDFYPDPAREIFWKVELWDEATGSYRVLFSRFEAPPQGILRLEVAPGRPRYRLTFMNVATHGPAEVEVEVLPQKVTPVRVTYSGAGESYVRSVEDKVRVGGRRREVTDRSQQVYRLSAEAGVPDDYQPRQQMAYAEK